MSRTTELVSSGKCYRIVDLPAAAGESLSRLPWVLRILMENLLRKNEDQEMAETQKSRTLMRFYNVVTVGMYFVLLIIILSSVLPMFIST